IYEDLEAEEFGRPLHGLANLIKYIIKISRLHVGIGTAGNSRRAVLEAIEYARYRTAYGKGLLKFPIFSKSLVEMHVTHSALVFSNFRSIHYWGENIPAGDVTIPLLKYKSSSLASEISHNAILALGGNGIVGDFSPLPRILNDSIINESWEGTHFLLTDHILHALEKRKPRESFFEEIKKLTDGASSVDELKKSSEIINQKINELQNILGLSHEEKDINRIYIADLTYEIFSIAQFINESIYDIQNKVKDSVYILYLNIYIETIKLKKEGFLSKDSLLNNEEIRNKIIGHAYLDK
ncbi:MAG: acyl-CoA dehydrogenase, partial [Leptospiraceae bacterium]|nr:acyl-CoA dehydrogenase [Leptospiraceae bacterium]